MDRRVKERLVGATILVVFIVAVVPELLSGPKRAAAPRGAAQGTEPIRNVTVDLATNRPLPGADDPAADNGATPAPGASNGDPSAARSATRGSGAGVETGPATADEGRHRSAVPGIAGSQAPPSAPKAATREAAPPEVPRHGWEAQLGSFANRPNAEALERRLRAQGFSVALATTGTGRALRYRIRVGPVTDRAGAQKTIARLKKAGHSASIAAQ